MLFSAFLAFSAVKLFFCFDFKKALPPLSDCIDGVITGCYHVIMVNLTSRTYRFSQTTLDQIEWLQNYLGGMDATNVLRVAVADLYDRKRSRWKAVLVKREAGRYALLINGQPLLTVPETALERLPEAERTAMLQSEIDGLSAMARLLLVAAAGDEEIWLDHSFLDTLGGDRPG